MKRQQEMVTSIQRACNQYIGELFEMAAAEIEAIQLVDRRRWLLNEHNASVSVAYLERMRGKLERLASDVNAYHASYRERVSAFLTPFTVSYKKYLDKLLRDDWLSFPQQLFGERSRSEKHVDWHALKDCNLTGTEVDFGQFMEIQEVEDIQLWPVKFWQKLVTG